MKNFTVLSQLGIPQLFTFVQALARFQLFSRFLRHSDNQIYALKKVSKSSEKKVKMNNLSVKEKQQALNEVRILASIE